MPENKIVLTGIGQALLANKFTRVGEIVVPFVAAMSLIAGTSVALGNNPIAYIGSIWAANAVMLCFVFWGLSMRGQHWSHFGLSFRLARWRSIIRVVLQSLVVFVVAMAAFVIAAVLMANIVGMPEADMSQYKYLQGNLARTILALVSVYFVSSFAEEVIYRGFLIHRIAELGADSKTAQRLAIVLSSLVFGLVHSDWGISGMVQASAMGLALALCYIAFQRNLWVVILAHGYMDTILIWQMYFAEG